MSMVLCIDCTYLGRANQCFYFLYGCTQCTERAIFDDGKMAVKM